MKKIVMMAVMAVAAVSANAQVWVGGEVGFGTSHVNGESTDKEFFVKPEVGYSLNDKFDVALAVGYSYASEKEFSKSGKKISGSNANTWEINPYVRYKFVKAGNFFAFVDGGLNYSTIHFQGVKNNVNQFGVSVVPGIAYSVSDKVTLVSHLGEGLYYDHVWMKDVARGNEFGFKLLNQISFGAYVNL